MRLFALIVTSAAAALLVFAPAQLTAQEPPLRTEIIQIDDATYPNARAVVNLEDATGGGDQNLGRENFKVSVNGNDAPVVDASLASSQNLPLDVLFVMDTSGSMAGEPISQAKAAAEAFIAALAPADRVAVMSFDEDVKLVQDYTNDRAAAEGALASLAAHGNTALYRATAGAALTAGRSKASRRAIVLLSDGADFGVNNDVTRDVALNAAASAGVPFFTVAEGSDIDADYLGAVAQNSKGRFLSAPTPGDLKALYDSIARLLQSQYVVTFDRSAANGAAEVPVLITVTSGSRAGEATFSYRPVPAPAPAITISGLTAGEALSAKREITAEVASSQPPSSVTFRVDGAVVAETTAAPYVYSYDPAHFGGGEHRLSVEADFAGSAPSTIDVAFTSTPPAGGSGGGLPLLPIGAAGGGAAILLIVALFVIKRRNRGAAPRPGELAWRAQAARSAAAAEGSAVEEDALPAETIGEALGLLISRAGPDAGNEYEVGGRPVSIGSGTRCAVRIDDDDLSAEEARIWVRNERLMVHRMTRLTSVAADGTVGGWTILDAGDSFEIGAHRFEFRLLPTAAPQSSPIAPEVDDTDRVTTELPTIGGFATARLANLMPRDSLNPEADFANEIDGGEQRAS